MTFICSTYPSMMSDARPIVIFFHYFPYFHRMVEIGTLECMHISLGPVKVDARRRMRAVLR